VFAGQLGAWFQLGKSLRLEAAAMVESSAVPASRVTALAIDGTKLDAFGALRWQISPRWRLWAGYGIVAMPPVETATSDFSPRNMVQCVDAAYDIDLRECQLAAAGRGRPTTAGDYFKLLHRASIGISFALQ
jgi:hypothetical protein